jgi:hypothetical protein
MGMKRLDFKWCLIHGMKRGGGGNSQRMRCGAQGIHSMAGEARATLEGGGGAPLFRAEGGRRGRSGLSGLKGPIGRQGSWAN